VAHSPLRSASGARSAVPVAIRLRQDLNSQCLPCIYIAQGGLGMPDRDYYLDTKNPKFADVRTKYQAYITQL
jgi:putative endopeptidase